LEDEISLIEIITTLWKGKFIIISVTVAAMLITALFSYFLVTPLYRATATFDPAPYKYKAADVVRTKGSNASLYSTLEDLVENPDAVLTGLTITAEGELVVINAEQPDPQLAVDTAEIVTVAIAQAIANDYLVTLNINIVNLQRAIKFYEEKIDELYPGVSLADNEALLEDPVYLALKQEQGNLTRDLINAMISQEQVEITDKLNFEQHINHASLPGQPFNMRWKLNVAVSAVLGLMVSVFIVFTIPFVKSLKENRA
jgi:LPS O-antigen subunit length determinant protein (WzzB/FepE family)